MLQALVWRTNSTDCGQLSGFHEVPMDNSKVQGGGVAKSGRSRGCDEKWTVPVICIGGGHSIKTTEYSKYNKVEHANQGANPDQHAPHATDTGQCFTK